MKSLVKITNLITVTLGITSSALAANRFEQMELFREMQQKAHIEDSTNEASRIGKSLLAQLDVNDGLYGDTRASLNSINAVNPDDSLEAGIKFATGTKDEYYCKDQGLVYAKGTHNDHTISELRLIKSNRVMDGSYAIMKSGDWIYEIDNEYREPIRSNLWILSSTPNSYHIKELRETANGTDDLWAKGSWEGNNISTSNSSHGQSYEPIPMYMGFDYHNWGTYDLGYNIRFEVGFKDQARSRESTYGKKSLILTTGREVVEHLNDFKYTDSKGDEHSYTDCFRVHLKIDLKNIEEKRK